MGLFFGADVGLVEKRSGFFYVFLELVGFLGFEGFWGLDVVFGILAVVLEEMIAILIVIEYDLFEDLDEVTIGVGVAIFDRLQLGLHDL